MTHFMMDLETTGTIAGCGLVSISIIAMDINAGEPDDVFMDDGFYCVVNRDSCLDAMLHEDAGTMAWWRKQSAEARKALDASFANEGDDLKEAVTLMTNYVGAHVSPRNAKVWGNGADFDNPIMRVAARQIGIELPWQWGNRCYRTIKNLHEILPVAIPPVTRSGTYHNALDDAKTQALHFWDIISTLRNALEQ